MDESLKAIVSRLWVTHENAEWVTKTDVLPLNDLHEWMTNKDIEVLGFVHAMLHDSRFRIEPPIEQVDYIKFVKHYVQRCLQENPNGEWSDSRYSAGGDLVNVFASLWRDPLVPRPVLTDLKTWLGKLYKESNREIRTCIVHATLEHLFEQKDIRQFFSDWQEDELLKAAYGEACEWYKGGGRTPPGRP